MSATSGKPRSPSPAPCNAGSTNRAARSRRRRQKYRFSVPGQPVPLPRPRLGRMGQVYIPRPAMEWRAAIAACARNAGISLMREVTVAIRVPRTAKGDLDNHIKIVLDALIGIAYRDDREVQAITARFSECDELEIEVMGYGE